LRHLSCSVRIDTFQLGKEVVTVGPGDDDLDQYDQKADDLAEEESDEGFALDEPDVGDAE